MITGSTLTVRCDKRRGSKKGCPTLITLRGKDVVRLNSALRDKDWYVTAESYCRIYYEKPIHLCPKHNPLRSTS